MSPAGEASALAADFREQPYWWDAAPLEERAAPEDLPPEIDVAIVGSGFTGLSAALPLLRAGRSVAIVDAEAPGHGASRRNAGYVGRTLKRSVGWLAAHHGEAHAIAIYRELDDALRTVESVVAEEGIECHFRRCGRFVGANSPRHYDELARDLEETRRLLGFEFEMIPRADQHREIATDRWHGGAVIPDLGSLHPGLYHAGLLARARALGARVVGHTPVRAVSGGGGGEAFRVATDRGAIRARTVVIATNGYTPRAFGWLARRVIPFTGYMAATEALPAGTIDALLPNRRTYLDTKLDIDFLRPAPDRERILFGGRTGSGAPNARAKALEIREDLRRILPDLGEVRLAHAWLGRCAATFDFMPHLGGRDGYYYALGYNFAGVPMGSYLGRRIAGKVLGTENAPSAFESPRFPSFPLYDGRPWFVPLAMRWFRLADAWKARG